MAQILSPLTAAAKPRFKLVFFVPPENRQAVQTAIFNVGAGKYPQYSECAWATLGTGQFRPSDAAKPHIGSSGDLEEVKEYRVEILCLGNEMIRGAVEALKRSHPYEEPAYEVYRLEDF